MRSPCPTPRAANAWANCAALAATCGQACRAQLPSARALTIFEAGWWRAACSRMAEISSGRSCISPSMDGGLPVSGRFVAAAFVRECCGPADRAGKEASVRLDPGLADQPAPALGLPREEVAEHGGVA